MSAVASKEMSRLHDLMCVEALEGGLNAAQRREFDKLADNMPEVNTSYYWEALGAADLALYGASLVPPGDARKAWLQDASAHFGWSDTKPVRPKPDKPAAQAVPAVDPLDETVVVGLEVVQHGADEILDEDDLAASSLEDGAGPSSLDETVMDWNTGDIDVDQYVADRGLRDSAVLARSSSNAFGWSVIAGLVLLLATAFAFRAQILELAGSFGLVPVHDLQGEEAFVTLDASGASIGGFVWDGARQRGLLSIDAMPASVDSQRQFQVWVVDSGRAGAAIPVALLRTNVVAHEVSIESTVLIKQYGGLLISSEPLGGALVPSKGSVIARVEVEAGS
ncbi:MAG: hypothetical protein ACPGSC_00705 [Granulosicoccaceae bacterium]